MTSLHLKCRIEWQTDDELCMYFFAYFSLKKPDASIAKLEIKQAVRILRFTTLSLKQKPGRCPGPWTNLHPL
jgi:hypothetical protein